ncbi:MAG: [protein-PII] uridylyltransferase [Gammaproteobacteria bacterium 39-13]|nr:[protein-PII] uridylyltransferase [Gammaproteobacteria bacterium]OJV85278.1 MAG: [protein-PII] uridylyltransferase [Gammaproteobacteria bacterium 39-13]
MREQALILLDLNSQSPGNIRQILQQNSEKLNTLFWQGQDILQILNTRSFWLDQILTYAWQKWMPESDACLIAVGGYGCQRIHPSSDADILILKSADSPTLNQSIETFIAYCWDCGIKLGSSVRTLSESLYFAANDITIFTNLLNARLIIGQTSLFKQLQETILYTENLWPFKDFFEAKCVERQNRYLRYADTEYNLEPNIKDSPGGLRDIDTICWLAMRKYHEGGLEALLRHQDIPAREFQILVNGQAYLWRIRYGLHLTAKKLCDRLFFEYQESLARQFGFQDKTLNLAISSFMQQYFQTVTKIREITDMMCQHFAKTLKTPAERSPSQKLSPFCEIVDEYIEITDIHALTNPENLMQLFVFVAQHNLKGFSAEATQILSDVIQNTTIESFQNKLIADCFLNILTAPFAYQAFALMHRLGLLQIYIPEFSAIVGQMQYDLFHIYTVDAHTLLVLRNIDSFFQNTPIEKFDLLNECKNNIKHIEILRLAGFFHDIGKGQGGDHSLIGSQIVHDFCHRHQINTEAADLVAWLVQNHLLMSQTAQRKDIFDKNVIAEFAHLVQSHDRLSYLYLLTVADILATNPALWNSWRAALLQDLYKTTSSWLKTETHEQKLSVEQNAHEALQIINTECPSISSEKVNMLWQEYNQEYFMLENPASIAWQTQIILSNQEKGKSFTIALKPHWNQVGTDIFIYAPESLNLFASICATLEKIFLTIVEARINSTTNHYSLQSFVVLEISGQPIAGPQRLHEIQHALSILLTPFAQKNAPLVIPFVSRHVPRRLKYFSSAIHVKISTPLSTGKTVVEIDAPDFPGLLARIGEAFVKGEVVLHSAKINTLGNKVEDVFFVSDKLTGQPITQPERVEQLKSLIEKSIVEHCK